MNGEVVAKKRGPLEREFKTARVMWWFHDEIARPEIGEFLRQAEKLVEGLHDARRSSAAERKRPIIFVCQGLGGLLIEKVSAYRLDVQN